MIFQISVKLLKCTDRETTPTDSPSLRPCDFRFKLIYEAHMEPSYIIFSFSNLYLMNQLEAEGRPSKKERPFSYRIEVTKNGKTIVNYDYNCFFTQKLHFLTQAARWLCSI